MANGSWERARRLRNLYLRSFDTKLVATVDANRKLRQNRRVPRDELAEIAGTLDPWNGTDEPARLSVVRKRSGGFRPITSFGIRNRALQILVSRAMESFALPRLHPRQYARRGGRPTACQAVRDALGNGYKWEVQVDIADCYGSFDPERVRQLLPLPKRVTDAVVLSRNLNLVDTNSLPYDIALMSLDPIRRGRQGIPQGSAVSPLVAEMLLASIAFELPEGVRCVVYADDIIILTRTRREAVAILETLRVALRRHPAGPLMLSRPELRRVSYGFEYLGYRFKTMYGTPRVTPTERNLREFWRKFRVKLALALIDREQLRQLPSFIRGWTAAFELWRTADAFREIMLREADRAAAFARRLERASPRRAAQDSR